MNKAKAIRVFLVDDHPAVRQGLALLLAQHGHVICAEAGSLAEAKRAAEKAQAEIALVDLSLGEESGLELLPLLKELGQGVLIYSMHEDPETIERSFRAGADGFITKREVSDVLVNGVQKVLNGQRFISPRAAQGLASRALSPATAPSVELSDREKQIVNGLGLGEGLNDIALGLGISARTVETYCSRIMEKIGLDGMKQLRKYAINQNLKSAP